MTQLFITKGEVEVADVGVRVDTSDDIDLKHDAIARSKSTG